ncbi:MAG: ATP-binding cassette domain-containing protein, partial [Chitinophagia bacterium]|nr:ATP-binding cassette domain-containing protein [Chitinophagia bacterium]
RIAPAVLRIQQGAIQIRGNIGIAKPTIDLIESLGVADLIEEKIDEINFLHVGFDARVQLNKVSFTYPLKNEKVICEATLQFGKGKIVAFVGPSGAGKTTIIDLMLGVLNPDEGIVTISGLSPALAISTWPGSIAYVPQDVMISNGTIKENVALGYPEAEVIDEDIWKALEAAQLSEFIKTLPNGLNTQTGDRGTRLSGGQRQRLGIARAMFTRPLLLILDEATSSLDGETEANITDSVQKMRGEVTVVMIAHRLSTVRHADLVVYSVNKEAILLVGFNRPEFLEARLNEISSFSCKNLYIAIDGPRVNYHDEVAHEQIMKNLEIWKNKIKFVEIISKNNIGLALNITNAVSTILKNNQKVLIIEDDVSLQKPAFESILRNEALDLSCVATVGGFGFMAKPKFFSEFTKNSFRLTPFFCAWGWSINREKWKNYSLDLSNLNIEKELKHSKIWNSLTEKDKIIWEFRFKKVKSNPFYTWDTQMQFMTFKYDLYNVLPFYRL